MPDLTSPENALEAEDEQQLARGGRLSVVELYHRTLERRGFKSDSSQLRAVERLQQLYEEWTAYKARRSNALWRLVVHPALPRGVYLWGGVGRGKSFLMDSFYLCLPLVRKRRVHFHHFMRDVHRELEELKGREDPLSALAELVAKRYRLICFDEMHVNDIADAMIVGRLLGRIMDLGVVWFDFAVICGWGRSQHDYLDLSKRFHTVIVSGVPRMGLKVAEEARRFTLMVDVFYDNRVKLIVSAEAGPEKLLKIEEDPGDARLRAMVFEFDRTASRLVEIQSRAYLAEARRTPEQ